jgi:hypothetical protein
MAHEMSKENFICSVTRYQPYTIGYLLWSAAIRYQLLLPAISHTPSTICSSLLYTLVPNPICRHAS